MRMSIVAVCLAVGTTPALAADLLTFQTIKEG
jgi:hypothetical protein